MQKSIYFLGVLLIFIGIGIFINQNQISRDSGKLTDNQKNNKTNSYVSKSVTNPSPLTTDASSTSSRLIEDVAKLGRASYKDTKNIQPPDFREFKDVKARKEAFFEFLSPFIRAENRNIWEKRETLKSIKKQLLENERQSNLALGSAILDKLVEVAAQFKVDSSDKTPLQIIDSLLLKIDVIPPGLVLAQAANESAWGTSRFAREGNNYFGQWCFKKGCGLIPLSRNRGKRHEVAKFYSARNSVASYMKNININPAYKKFRQIRAKLRAERKMFDSKVLASGLINYSERREAYIHEIVSMIQYNQIDRRYPLVAGVVTQKPQEGT